MKLALFGISFAAAHYIWCAFLLVPCAIILFLLYRKKRYAIRQLADKKWRSQLLLHVTNWRIALRGWLFFATLICLYIALLRPQWDSKEQIVEQTSRDIFIGVDISRSMLVKDLAPDRLNFAKQKIKRLLKLLPSERVGLIIFSGTAFVQCPLTTDHTAFYLFLDQLDVETISSGTTALDQALKKALQAFQVSPERKSKLLVVFTDGEDFSSNLAAVTKEAADSGLHVVTVGVGTPEGGPIPLFDRTGKPAGHQLDDAGAVVISRLNEGILSSLATNGNGMYTRVTQDDTDLRSLVHHVEQFEREKFQDTKVAALEDRYPYFVAASLVLSIIEWFL